MNTGKPTTTRIGVTLVLVSTVVVLAGLAQQRTPSFDPQALVSHIQTLASDRFEGRAPASRGEELTVQYLVERFKAAGLQPGNPDGTFIQPVPLVSLTPDPSMRLRLTARQGTRDARFRDDFVAWTRRVSESVSVSDADMVFVGYGVTAPEYGWDDFKGADLSGKMLVVLVGDPPVPDSMNPAQLDPRVFGGRAMTYYGRWTYKFDMGAQQRAAGVLIVHETEAAGYPYSVVQGMGGERFGLITPDNGSSLAAVEGWMSVDEARRVFAASGLDFGALKQAAASRAFTPVPLNTRASVTVRNTVRRVDSRNVVARLDGSDPRLKDEYVIYTAHWDHLGIGAPVDGDSIYNGARDNATGTAALLELAREFARLKPAPRRTMLFLADTAEEQGLLGTEHYSTVPLYPLTRTLAVINMDGMNVHGRTTDLTVVGLGLSDLDDYVSAAAREQGRQVTPDAEPEKGSYYRSDHFPFAKRGVPSLYAGGGSSFVGRTADFAERVRRDYTERRYHRPSDEYHADWDLSGQIEDMQVLFRVGRAVADADRFPAWKPGAEFKAVRERALQNDRRP
ncbi:MAG: M28 family metallopeptidase [Vicinamibacterales bacterium]